MANDAKNPKLGDLAIDATDIAADLKPIKEDARGLNHEHKGLQEAMKEVLDNQEKHGDDAGITAGDIARLNALNAKLERIDRLLGPSKRLYETLASTRVQVEDEREHALSLAAQSVETRAKQNKRRDLLTHYPLVRAYRSAAATLAAQTRKRHEKDAQEQPAKVQK